MKCSTELKNKRKIPVVVVFAPTASGKTSLAEKLFASDAVSPLGGRGEIVSADSMQVYKGMNIGTAKPDADFLRRLPHHLIDVCLPSYQFGVGEFIDKADAACEDIYSRGKLPIVLGGTSFYIRNFLYGLPTTPTATEEVRCHLRKRLKIEGLSVLYTELQAVDEIAAAKIHPNDEYRILRALEVYYASGMPLSSFELSQKLRGKYFFLPIGLVREREDLYERIDGRVDLMFQQGLWDEFYRLLQEGYTKDSPGMQAIGYREFFMTNKSPYDSDFITKKEEIRLLIKKNTRHYAKKQLTFFNSLKDVNRFFADDIKEIERKVLDFMNLYLT